MSGDGPEQQTLALSLEEARILRGALHVINGVADLDLDARGVSLPIEVNTGRQVIYQRLLADLDNRLRMANQTGTDSVITVLDRAEAQAVRDAAGIIPALAETAAGRNALVEVGFFNTPRSEILESDLEIFSTVADRIIPTNVRDVEAHELGLEEELLQSMIDTALAQIKEHRLPWTGFEAERQRLEDIDIEFTDPKVDRNCQRFFKALVVVTKIAVAGVRHYNDVDTSTDEGREVVGNFPVDVDAAFESIVVQIEGNGCLEDETVLDLFDRVDHVVNSLTPGSQNAVQTNANDLLRFLERTEEPTDEERLLNHISRIRANLGDALDRARSQEMVEAEVERRVRRALPDSRADCDEMLASLAEIVSLEAEIIAHNEGLPIAQQLSIDEPENARRAILHKMGFEKVGVADPIPGPRRDCFPRDAFDELRDSLVSVTDPLDVDPDDVETRAFAALSDIRNLFQDPRRG